MKKATITVTVNRKSVKARVQPNQTLLSFLRDDLALTGTKEGCGIGECGACTVLLDGKAVNACLVLAARVDGSEVTTIEGLAEGNRLHPLQQAFIAHGAVQCGFCTPGVLLTAMAFLQDNPAPTRDQIRRAIVGNLCRCTGYQQIVDAIEAVSRGEY